uniref:Odorant-binding protein 5 n=1 Tax=Helopeltis theivora TaxID=393766 RepID=A0A6B9RVC3_9HEMI|nr:odorant-binding protein 5 [Helopeltis theivora]
MLRLKFAQILLFFGLFASSFTAEQDSPLCKPPPHASHKLEKVIGQCQDEIKYILVQEALSALRETVNIKGTGHRGKRDIFTGEERRIAGCLLQCVYRKMNALDNTGFPTATGLVKIYSEGVEDKNYYLATIQGVQVCLAKEIEIKNSNSSIVEAEGYYCDVSYDLFNCVSEQIEQLCGITP